MGAAATLSSAAAAASATAAAGCTCALVERLQAPLAPPDDQDAVCRASSAAGRLSDGAAAPGGSGASAAAGQIAPAAVAPCTPAQVASAPDGAKAALIQRVQVALPELHAQVQRQAAAAGVPLQQAWQQARAAVLQHALQALVCRLEGMAVCGPLPTDQVSSVWTCALK